MKFSFENQTQDFRFIVRWTAEIYVVHGDGDGDADGDEDGDGDGVGNRDFFLFLFVSIKSW